MTLRRLPELCEHGHKIHKHFKSLDDGITEFFIPECRNESTKNLKPHKISTSWPEDTDRFTTYELERGAGQRKPRSDRGKPRKLDS